jgi:hypothetical protein
MSPEKTNDSLPEMVPTFQVLPEFRQKMWGKGDRASPCITLGRPEDPGAVLQFLPLLEHADDAALEANTITSQRE